MRKPKLIYFLLVLLLFCPLAQAQKNDKVLQWTEQIGGSGHDATGGIVIDNENTIYIAGTHSQDLKEKNKDKDKEKEKEKSSKENYDLFVSAYRSNGKQKWTWTAGGEQTDRVNALTLLPDKKVAIAGTISSATSMGNKKSRAEGKQLFIASIDEKGKTDWLKTFTYTKSASLYLLESDKEGTLFASGTFSDSLTVDGKTLVSQGKRDVFLLSLTAKEGLIEFKSIGSEFDEMPSAMAIDGMGNVLLGGSFTKELIIDKLRLRASKKDISKNIFLLTFSPELEVIASASYSSKNYLTIKALKVDRLNRRYLTGNFVKDFRMQDKTLKSVGQADIYLAQFSEQQKLLWLRQFGSKKMDYAGDLVIDPHHGVILTGAINDTIVSDSISIDFKGAYSNAFAAQFSEQGITLWSKQLPGEGNSMSYSSALDSKGDLYLSGLFSKTMESEASELMSHGKKDVFIAKFRNCESDEKAIEGNDMICPGEELVLSTSIKYREITWNDTLTNTKSIVLDQAGKYWVHIMDQKGCYLADTLEVQLAELPDPDLGNDTILDVQESIRLQPVGSFIQYLWHDNSVDSVFTGVATKNRPGIELYHVMVVDSNACMGSDSIEVSYIDKYPWMILSENSKLVIYPNPVKDILNWRLETEEPGKITVDIADVKGRVVYTETIKSYQPGQLMQISMQAYRPGVYLLRATDGQRRINVSLTHN